MRFSYIKLRVPIDRVPECSNIFNDRDVFALPDYEAHAESQFVRIKHPASGKQVVVHAQMVKEGVPVSDEQPKQFKQHMQGKR